MADAERMPRTDSRFKMDGVLALVVALALLLAAAAVIRTSPDQTAGQAQGGLRTLGPNEHLVAFDDFNQDPDAWLVASGSDSEINWGGVLGPFEPNMGLRRTVEIPNRHDRLVMIVDVIPLSGGTAPALQVASDGAEITINPLGADPASGRARVSIVIDNPAAPAVVTISAPSADGAWALDNLTIVSARQDGES